MGTMTPAQRRALYESCLLYTSFGLYPTALLEWFKAYGPLLKPGCIFTDVSGVKTGLVEPVPAMCPAGVEFIASHPMAGRETSSVEHAAEVNFAQMCIRDSCGSSSPLPASPGRK